MASICAAALCAVGGLAAAEPSRRSSLARPQPRARQVVAPLSRPRNPAAPSVAARRGPTQRTIAQASPPASAAAPTAPKPRLAVFVSGGGSNFTAIHAQILAGAINADVAVVVSDVPGCGGWNYAQSHGIPTVIYPKTNKVEANPQWAGQALSPEALVAELKDTHNVDYVILAGYLKLIPESLVRGYKRAMVNIHPALLPSFGGHGCYGAKVHEKVVESGVRFSGPTVHFVDEEYDTGAIIAQRAVPVYPTDTPSQVAKRVLAQEHQVYPEVVSALVDGRITFREDGVPILWSAH
eukprot:jgi/Tetstr1/430207/TSEL_020036.t1